MAEAKWVKISIGMLNDPKLLIINDMEDNNLIFYIWTSSILLAGQSNRNGLLYLSDDMPYTYKTLSVVFKRTVEEVKKSYKVLIKLGMIEVTEDKIFKIKNWDKHKNIDGLEKIRKQTNERVIKHREKKGEEKKAAAAHNDTDEKIDLSKEYSLFSVDNDNGKAINTDDDKFCEEELNSDKLNNFYKIEKCNVTDSNINEKCNVTVTEQNKKEIKNKKKNKIEKDNNIKSTSDDESDMAESSELDNSVLNSAAMKLLQHYEQVTGLSGGLDIGSLRLAIIDHGELNVRKAIDEAIETGKSKSNMRYINGILKNWKKEGYTEDDVGGMNNVSKSNEKSSTTDSNEFKGIKPKKCRELTEEERKNIESNLI